MLPFFQKLTQIEILLVSLQHLSEFQQFSVWMNQMAFSSSVLDKLFHGAPTKAMTSFKYMSTTSLNSFGSFGSS